MQWDDLPGLFPELPDPLRWVPLLQRHYQLLEAASGHTRVSSVAPDDVIQRHYAESLEIWRVVVESVGPAPGLLADVGSGGGFPGLVMACIAPATRFALIEPLKKRARLLESATADLGLGNVEVHAVRGEEAGRGPLRGKCDVVTARAVAGLSPLLEYTVPLGAPGVAIVLPKGSAGVSELESARNAMTVLGCEYAGTTAMRPEISTTLSTFVFRKVKVTPGAYPRRPGIPSREPL